MDASVERWAADWQEMVEVGEKVQARLEAAVVQAKAAVEVVVTALAELEWVGVVMLEVALRVVDTGVGKAGTVGKTGSVARAGLEAVEKAVVARTGEADVDVAKATVVMVELEVKQAVMEAAMAVVVPVAAVPMGAARAEDLVWVVLALVKEGATAEGVMAVEHVGVAAMAVTVGVAMVEAGMEAVAVAMVAMEAKVVVKGAGMATVAREVEVKAAEGKAEVATEMAHGAVAVASSAVSDTWV